MKIRMTVEYDSAWVTEDKTDEQIAQALVEEKQAWLDGSVGVWDIHPDIGTVKWEIIP